MSDAAMPATEGARLCVGESFAAAADPVPDGAREMTGDVAGAAEGTRETIGEAAATAEGARETTGD